MHYAFWSDQIYNYSKAMNPSVQTYLAGLRQEADRAARPIPDGTTGYKT
jgi:hypothetical protein